MFTHTQVATTLTYRSNTYNCPYDVTSSYNDIRNTFAPCTDPSRTAVSGPTEPAVPGITVYGDSLLHFTNQTDVRPRYSIGQVATNDRISFVVNLVYPTGDTQRFLPPAPLSPRCHLHPHRPRDPARQLRASSHLYDPSTSRSITTSSGTSLPPKIQNTSTSTC